MATQSSDPFAEFVSQPAADDPFAEFVSAPMAQQPAAQPQMQPVVQEAPKKLQIPQRGEHPAKKYLRQGFVKGLIDPINAAAQVVDAALPQAASDALTRGDQWLYENTGGLLGSPEATYQEALRKEERAYQAQRAAEGETGLDIDRLAGNIAITALPMVKGAQALQAAGAGAKTTGAVLGGASGLVTPATSDNFAAEKAAQVGGGALAGFAIPAVTQGISRLVSPQASTNPALQKVIEEGGKPTIGQALGGRWNVAEEKAMSLPIVGDMIATARKRAIESIEPAAYNRALTTIGQKLPEGMKGREAASYTERVLRDKYDDVLNKIGAITPDEQFGANVENLTSLVGKMNIPQAAKDRFNFALDSVRSSIDENGVMTSEAFKKAESALGGISRKMTSSQDVYDDALAPAVMQLREEMRGMLTRQSGKYAKELQNVNKGWANFKVLQKAGSGIGAAEGQFTPSQLLSAVRAADKSNDKSAYFRGNALMQDLAEASKTVMGDKVPNSFTADRAMFGLGALGSAAVNPAIPLSLAAGGAAYTAPVQNALVAAIAKRPEIAAEIGRQLQSAAATSAAPSALVLSPLAARVGAGDGQ